MRTYLAGPIFGCNEEEQNGWRNRVRELMPEAEHTDPIDLGYTPDDHEEKFDQIVMDDLRLISQCDVVIAEMGRPSIGTAMELWFAHSLKVPIVLICTFRHPWLLYVADIICENEEAAVMAVRHLLPNTRR